ncbi:hypothetical protein RO04_01850 [Aggregatibacter actinomycetemcomitans]|nr:hypothetical protein RO04_04850 [Aggregatibacter actinomycetemcomitans]OZV18570.1 hypothetical protein RO04_01850 [Aggregatibacter actinomycetemcomitans]
MCVRWALSVQHSEMMRCSFWHSRLRNVPSRWIGWMSELTVEQKRLMWNGGWRLMMAGCRAKPMRIHPRLRI